MGSLHSWLVGCTGPACKALTLNEQLFFEIKQDIFHQGPELPPTR